MEEQPKPVKASKEIKQDAKTDVKHKDRKTYTVKEKPPPIEVNQIKLSLFGDNF